MGQLKGLSIQGLEVEGGREECGGGGLATLSSSERM